ncbi:MAG: HAD-IC family P-type ATPase [Oscillospiraceae bacterium]|nr:HAD-IC family P-type ATPase [Oscillospiraceae bacterium]
MKKLKIADGLSVLIKKKTKQPARSERLPVFEAEPGAGLDNDLVAERVRKGFANTAVEPPTKSVGKIVADNLLTYFNLVFFSLAACIIAVRSWNDLMFMIVVLANIAIGIIQELRSKKTLDKLNLLSVRKGIAVRGSKQIAVNIENMVRDDIVIFAAGNQIYADASVVEGEVTVNEALITGEADEIKKVPGAGLMSGSFVVSGMCRARLTAVGEESYAAKLTTEAKKSAKRKQSEMMRSLSKLVKWIGIVLFPFGAALVYKEIYILGRSVEEGVTSTVGALIGMIPEGLYLLTSVALVAGIMRLAQGKTLVRDMSCIETLARVDVLCVDKTGTITENKMIVEKISPLCEERYSKEDIAMIMSDYAAGMESDNETMDALKRYFTGEIYQRPEKVMPFSSVKKYSGISFHPDENYILGAPDVILGSRFSEYESEIERYSSEGCRVLLLALYDGDIYDEKLSFGLLPVSLVLLNNKVRPEASKTFEYFSRQGVAVKVISGDNALTVSEVASRAGIENAKKYIDARVLDTDMKIAKAAEVYTVFGRVTPEQKRKLITAMKKAGHTVAMTGDGVNDVLALKEADCSVAMASGSDVACGVSSIVLLNSDFSSMPVVVAEGRRIINNIERSASLFLVKNIFSFSLALVSLFFTLPYPVTPAQLSLVSMLTIGIPSLVLALEPNKNLVSGKFLKNVLYRALPGGFTDFFLVLCVLLFYLAFGMDFDEMATVCAVILGIVGILVIHITCVPYTKLRKLLIVCVCTAFLSGVLFLSDLFELSRLYFSGFLVLAVMALLAYPVMHVFRKGLDRLRDAVVERKGKQLNKYKQGDRQK